jgi:hypothetical protein
VPFVDGIRDDEPLFFKIFSKLRAIAALEFGDAGNGYSLWNLFEARCEDRG